MSLLSDQEYDEKMQELGFVEDKSLGKYFLNDMAFLMNIDDNVTNLSDLITYNSNNHLTYTAQALIDFSRRGAQLTIGPGAIDEYGVKHKQALYCTNYRELYSEQIDNEVSQRMK